MNETSPSPEPKLPDVKPSHAGARGVVDWRPAFLKALENVGVINAAAKAAEVSVMTVWRERKKDPEFATAYEEALGCGALLLEEEAIRRAKDGVRRILFNSKTGLPYVEPGTKTPECPDGLPYTEHVYSDALMVTLLKRHFPEYREPKGDVHVNTSVTNCVLTQEKLRELQQRNIEAFGR